MCRNRTLRVTASHAVTVLLAAMQLAVTPRVEAQAPAASASLAGIVIDAGNGTRLDGVTVTLEPSPQGLIVDPRGMLFTTRTIVTSTDGAYRFTSVPPGRYRIHVQRIGYRTTTFEADVRRPMDARISVGLELEPIALQAMQVEEHAAPTFRRVSHSPVEPEAARSNLERYRQDLFLTPDSRMLTMADLVEGITFGEGDVFRALQRFPGVATRDDYTAELWTRGAPWAQTRVSFDGLPLFNPVHAVGVFSAVTPDILGAVFFHPGVRSVSLGEGAAGAVELRSRPGDGAGAVDGSLDVSMASAKVTFDQNINNGRVAWIISARRSYLDVLTGGLDWLGLDDIDLPYAFHDLSGRIDVQLGARSALEVSGIWEDDRLFGNLEGILERTTARWGNAAARVTLHVPIGQWDVQHTLGFSRYRAHIEQFDTVAERAEPWVEPPSDNRIAHVRFASEFQSPAPNATPSPLAFGYEIVAQDARYDGPEPRFYPVRPDTAVRLLGQGAVWNAGIWAETRLRLGERVTFAPGLRAESGTDVMNGAAVRLAPRFAIRYKLSPAQTISAAAGRSWQYLQSLAVAGPSAHPAFHAGQFWLWAGEDAPALRADVFTLGTERWLGGWLGSAAAYYRYATGVALPDPHPGKLAERPLFVVGENRAHGMEVGIRRVAGRWTTALAYTYGVSSIEAAGLTFPATTDRRHRVDATAGIRVPAGFRVGVAYSGMTGSPFTRVHTRSLSDCSLFGFGCGQTGTYIEDPNAQRTPGYRSLDATVQWARNLGHVEIGAYVQVRNVTGRDNATTYSGSLVRRVVRTTTTDAAGVLQDRFERGLPRMPLVGARIAF